MKLPTSPPKCTQNNPDFSHTVFVDILHQFISISNPNIIFWFCMVPCRTFQFTVFIVILPKKQTTQNCHYTPRDCRH